MGKFQTLSEFVEVPFGNINREKRNTLEDQYQKMKKQKGFKVEGFTTIDDNYLIHVLVPSDSNPNQVYDVVVLFFTDETVEKKRTTFSNYYVKFFSNSPSFIYQYAYLYKTNGFLIDFLYDKLDPEFSETAPKKPSVMFYDKSIYCASRLLLDNNFVLLSKLGIILQHKKTQTKFFSDIKTFENIKITSELASVDKKINKELEKNRSQKRKSTTSKKNSLSDSQSVIRYVKPKKGTRKNNSLKKGTKSVIRKIPKK